MNSRVLLFLLPGGVEVISECEEIGKGWKLYRPYKILNIPVIKPGQQGMQIEVLMHLCPLIPNAMSQVLSLGVMDLCGEPLTPTKEAEMLYNQTVSGILMPH